MTEVKITLGRLIRVWWALQWRCMIVGLFLIPLLWFLWRYYHRVVEVLQLGSVSSLPDIFWPPLLNLTAALFGFLLCVPFGMLVIRWFMAARFSDFRVALVQDKPRNRRGLRIEPRIGAVS